MLNVCCKLFTGEANSTVSSAYNKHNKCIVRSKLFSEVSSAPSHLVFNKCYSRSFKYRENKTGDKVSPCRIPLLQENVTDVSLILYRGISLNYSENVIF